MITSQLNLIVLLVGIYNPCWFGFATRSFELRIYNPANMEATMLLLPHKKSDDCSLSDFCWSVLTSTGNLKIDKYLFCSVFAFFPQIHSIARLKRNGFNDFPPKVIGLTKRDFPEIEFHTTSEFTKN